MRILAVFYIVYFFGLSNAFAGLIKSYGERGDSINHSLVKILCEDPLLDGKHVRTIGILGVDSYFEGYIYLSASDFYASNENNAIHLLFDHTILDISYDSLKELEGHYVEVAGKLHMPHYVTGKSPRLGDHVWIEKISFILPYRAKVPGKRNQWRIEEQPKEREPKGSNPK